MGMIFDPACPLFFFPVSYRLRIFDHLGQPIDRLTVRAGN